MSATDIGLVFDSMNERSRTNGENRRQRLASASDEELVNRAFELVGKIKQGKTQDNLYGVLTEAFERWSPEAMWSNYIREEMGCFPDDGDRRRFELESVREVMVERAAARIAARCSVDEAVSS